MKIFRLSINYLVIDILSKRIHLLKMHNCSWIMKKKQIRFLQKARQKTSFFAFLLSSQPKILDGERNARKKIRLNK